MLATLMMFFISYSYQADCFSPLGHADFPFFVGDDTVQTYMKSLAISDTNVFFGGTSANYMAIFDDSLPSSSNANRMFIYNYNFTQNRLIWAKEIYHLDFQYSKSISQLALDPTYSKLAFSV